jgi:hypothetical protein
LAASITFVGVADRNDGRTHISGEDHRVQPHRHTRSHSESSHCMTGGVSSAGAMGGPISTPHEPLDRPPTDVSLSSTLPADA